MIRGVNQSMINRYISGGGGSVYKYIGGGSDSNGENSGSITVEFNVLGVNDGSENNNYIKKDDAIKVFNEILSIDPEKYMIYYGTSQYGNTGVRMVNSLSCPYIYHYNSYYNEDSTLHRDINIRCCNKNIDGDDRSIRIIMDGNSFDYNNSHIFSANIVDTLPGMMDWLTPYKFTLYYMEC